MEADDLALTEASLLRDLTTLRARMGDRAAAVAETVRLRRRAAAKLADADGWLFSDDALQQATPSRWRAIVLGASPGVPSTT